VAQGIEDALLGGIPVGLPEGLANRQSPCGLQGSEARRTIAVDAGDIAGKTQIKR
jgi:hypothetical protein